MSHLRIGFNTRVSFTSDDGPAAGLRDGIELFRYAESLGYQGGWAYQRHFDHYLSSPLPFFSAAGQYTSHITLGTAVLPTRYQEPVLFAEAAANDRSARRSNGYIWRLAAAAINSTRSSGSAPPD